jgi:hypothetical protein
MLKPYGIFNYQQSYLQDLLGYSKLNSQLEKEIIGGSAGNAAQLISGSLNPFCRFTASLLRVFLFKIIIHHRWFFFEQCLPCSYSIKRPYCAGAIS